MDGFGNMKQPLISTQFLTHLDEMILERSGDLPKLIEASGLQASIFSGVESLIPFPLHLRLLDLAARELNWSTIALELASRQSIGFLGSIYPMLKDAASVQEGLKIFSRHLSLQAQAVYLRIEETQDSVLLTLETGLPGMINSLGFQNHGMALTKNLMHWMCGDNWKPRAVYFRHSESGDSQIYSNYFKAPVAFGGRVLSMSFDRKYMSRALVPEAHNISQQLRQLLEVQEELNVTSQVRFMIQALLPSGRCNTQAVADALGHTHRTLQRRLESEDTSFKAILDACRAQSAKHYLSNSHYRMSDISLLLGFADQSSFTRSFQRYFEMTPRQWQQENVKKK